MPRLASILLLLCVFAAFLLMLLVSLSTPIIKSLYLLEATAIPAQGGPPTSIATNLRFGVWGFCATSVLGQTNQECTRPHLGYIIDQTLLNDTGYGQIAQAILEGVTVVLILHPIAAGLTLISLLLAFPAARSHCWGILNLIIVIVAAFVTTAVLAIDFVLIGVTRSRVGPLTNGTVQIAFGNCPWMVLVVTILLWASTILGSLVVCNCFGCGRRLDGDWDSNEKQ